MMLADPPRLGLNTLIDTLRRLLSIALLCFFGLQFVVPLLAMGRTPESRLPACCRRGGDHHCMGMSGQDIALSDISPNPCFGHLATRCPYAPGTVSHHADPVLPPTGCLATASALAHPILAARNASMRRILQDRSRPKRGPPHIA